jgi:hypothetical protein
MPRSGSDAQRKPGRRVWFAAALAAAMVYALAAPAHARIVERDHFSGGDEEVIDDVCEFDLVSQISWEGRYHIREGKGNDTATPFFLHERFSWYEVVSAQGTFVTLQGREVVQETTAGHLGDAVFEFTTVVAGSTVLRDAAGKPIARNSGNFRIAYLLDKSEHPREPGGELVEVTDVRVNGPRALDDMTDEEFCALFE